MRLKTTTRVRAAGQGLYKNLGASGGIAGAGSCCVLQTSFFCVLLQNGAIANFKRRMRSSWLHCWHYGRIKLSLAAEPARLHRIYMGKLTTSQCDKQESNTPRTQGLANMHTCAYMCIEMLLML